MLTYNQEKFIGQAIESIMVQKTGFDYQLVIGEDCSADNTRSICETYASKFGNRIKLLPKLDANIGLIKNYMRTIKECNGKYIAICDGDDYWIDEYKLQKQVDFLEQNSDYSIVYSPIYRLLTDGNLVESYTSKIRLTLDFKDLIFENSIPSVSSMFRNIQDLEVIPPWISKFPYGDWPTYLWTIKNGGKIYCIEDITAVYRFNIGESSKIDDFNEVDISILKLMYVDKSFEKNKNLIYESIGNKYLSLMLMYNRKKKYFEAWKVYLHLFFSFPNKLKSLKIFLYSLKLSRKKAFISQ